MNYSVAGDADQARATRGGLSGRVYGVSGVTGDSPLQSAVLEDLSEAVRYRRWLAALARPYLGEHPIEVGSGTGDYALEWARHVGRFTATEAEESRLRTLDDRFAGHPVIATRRLLLGEPDQTDAPRSRTVRPSRSTCSSTSPTTSARCGPWAIWSAPAARSCSSCRRFPRRCPASTAPSATSAGTRGPAWVPRCATPASPWSGCATSTRSGYWPGT